MKQTTAAKVQLVLGAVCVSLGAWCIYRPAGYIVVGLFMLAGGVLTAIGGDEA